MDEHNRIEYGDAIRQGEVYMTSGASPEDAARRVFNEWSVDDAALKTFATEGLSLALKGERSEIPA